jgi:hypothetical protein
VDGGGSSSLPQKPGAGKKNSRQIWESGDTGLYQRTRSKSVRTKKQKTSKLADRQLTNLTCADTLFDFSSPKLFEQIDQKKGYPKYVE